MGITNFDIVQANQFLGPITAGNPFGKTWFVDGAGNNGDGKSPQSSFNTMAQAFGVIASGDTIYFRGNVREQLTTPTGVADVTIIGASTRPRHADTHPLNGEKAATWRLPLAGGSNVPMLIVTCPGWRFVNFLIAAHASNYAFELQRNAIEDATEIDSSHAEFRGIRFASGAGGINDTGGTFDVLIDGCRFQALTTACILGVGNIGVGQLMWHILNSHFDNFTNGVKIAAHECVIKGNYFTDGGTPNTTFVLNTSNGAGRDNFIVENYFQTLTANFNTPDIVGNATDVWNNTSIDGQASSIGREVGQPA